MEDQRGLENAKLRFVEARDLALKVLNDEKAARVRAEASRAELEAVGAKLRGYLAREEQRLQAGRQRSDGMARQLAAQRAALAEAQALYESRRSRVERRLFALIDEVARENERRVELSSARERLVGEVLEIDLFCAELHIRRDQSVHRLELLLHE